MAKLLAIKCSLVTLQLVSLSVASVIIIVYYNPWIKILIEANATPPSDRGDRLAEQFRSIEGEEIVIFLMCLATIVVSVVGIIGAVRCNRSHNYCLLNFYVTTLIIFLFITFVALCGTIWELINKLLNREPTDYLVVEGSRPRLTDPALNGSDPDSSAPDGIDLINSTDLSKLFHTESQPVMSSWAYITKSFFFILISATIYATSIKLTRKILDADEQFLTNDDDSGRHFNINDNDDDHSQHTKDSSFTRV